MSRWLLFDRILPLMEPDQGRSRTALVLARDRDAESIGLRADAAGRAGHQARAGMAGRAAGDPNAVEARAI